MVAIAAAGIKINWQDLSDISELVPLITRVYPNGKADINDFHNAGGMTILMDELLKNDLLHNDVQTIVGEGLDKHAFS